MIQKNTVKKFGQNVGRNSLVKMDAML